jgi:hypothetical protein
MMNDAIELKQNMTPAVDPYEMYLTQQQSGYKRGRR